MGVLSTGHYAFKSVKTGKFLSYQHNINNQEHVLQFSGEDVASPYSKFEVEEDGQNKDLVHIKSSINQKYWQRADGNNSWIFAKNEKQNPDKNHWSSTLFKPEKIEPTPASCKDATPASCKDATINGAIGTFRFVHQQLGLYIEPFSANGYDNALYAGRETQEDSENIIFVVVSLPRS